MVSSTPTSSHRPERSEIHATQLPSQSDLIDAQKGLKEKIHSIFSGKKYLLSESQKKLLKGKVREGTTAIDQRSKQVESEKRRVVTIKTAMENLTKVRDQIKGQGWLKTQLAKLQEKSLENQILHLQATGENTSKVKNVSQSVSELSMDIMALGRIITKNAELLTNFNIVSVEVDKNIKQFEKSENSYHFAPKDKDGLVKNLETLRGLREKLKQKEEAIANRNLQFGVDGGRIEEDVNNRYNDLMRNELNKLKKEANELCESIERSLTNQGTLRKHISFGPVSIPWHFSPFVKIRDPSILSPETLTSKDVEKNLKPAEVIAQEVPVASQDVTSRRKKMAPSNFEQLYKFKKVRFEIQKNITEYENAIDKVSFKKRELLIEDLEKLIVLSEKLSLREKAIEERDSSYKPDGGIDDQMNENNIKLMNDKLDELRKEAAQLCSSIEKRLSSDSTSVYTFKSIRNEDILPTQKETEPDEIIEDETFSTQVDSLQTEEEEDIR